MRIKALFSMPSTWPPEYGRYYSAIRFTIPITVLLHLALIGFFSVIRLREMVFYNIASTLWWCISLFLARHDIRIALVSNLVSIAEIVIHSTLCTYFIGWNYGFAFHLYTLPLVVFLLPNRHTVLKVTLMVITVTGFFVCAALLRQKEPVYAIGLLERPLFLVNVSVPLMFITIIARYYARFAEQSENRIAKAKAKSDFLLGNILPQPIIQKLYDEPGYIAEEYREVSVLFADVIGFTPATAHRSPREVVEFLDALFSKFDEIADRYALEKIKTIGDAYMITAGLPEPVPDPSSTIADCALEIMDRASKESFFGKQLAMRIGLHTGPVVAGIIGKKKFSYDLWGDTVNTAARMESHGEAGTIHTTGTVYEQLKENYRFESRGEIEIKGKGMLETYFLIGKKEA
ncbi:MAG: adenylate/guanylate cyclase domain-containing protein [Chitinispirillaceae bacterium]|nr:adenylate/guanylate cyclase domain-containing protein [Chitinispirillaceae bacterium]